MLKEKGELQRLIVRSRLCMIVIMVIAVILSAILTYMLIQNDSMGYSEKEYVLILILLMMIGIPTLVGIVCYIFTEVFARKIKEKSKAYSIASVLVAVHGVTIAVFVYMGFGGMDSTVSTWPQLTVSLIFFICSIVIFINTLKIKRETESVGE